MRCSTELVAWQKSQENDRAGDWNCRSRSLTSYRLSAWSIWQLARCWGSGVKVRATPAKRWGSRFQRIPEMFFCAFDGKIRSRSRGGLQMLFSSVLTGIMQGRRRHRNWDRKVSTWLELVTSLSTGSDRLVDFSSVERLSTSFSNYSERLFVRSPSLECTSQGFVSRTLHAIFQHLSHYSVLTGYTGEHLILEFMRKELFSHNKANNAYGTVLDRRCYVKKLIHNREAHQRKLVFLRVFRNTSVWT